MKNNGKSPTFKYVSGEERRPSEVQLVSRDWRLSGATHSSADLTWIRKWLKIQAPELSELESVGLELGSCCSDFDKLVSDELCRTRKRLFCAVNVLYIYFLKMYLIWKYGECNKSYEHGSKKCPLEVLSIFTFGIVRWRVRKIAADFYPQLLKNRLLQPVYLLRIVNDSLSKCWHAFCHARGWQTNDISHAAFTQARWNGAKIMAPRWRHDRAKVGPPGPVRVSETKLVQNAHLRLLVHRAWLHSPWFGRNLVRTKAFDVIIANSRLVKIVDPVCLASHPRFLGAEALGRTPPLDLSFWSFLTFLIRGEPQIENWKMSNVPRRARIEFVHELLRGWN